MKKVFHKGYFIILCAVFLALTFGCGKKEEAAKGPAATDAPSSKAEEVKYDSKALVAKVEGVALTKADLEKKVSDQMKMFQGEIPEEKRKEIIDGVKKQLIDEFVVLTVLTKEVERANITLTEKDIQAQLDKIKKNIPEGKSVDEFLKENNVSMDQIQLGIKIQRLVDKELGSNAKPTKNEISKFYKENPDKFKTPETAHVRHILVLIDAKDDSKTRAEKKAKIEKLRKQILDGADFAEIAKNNSDCPSKEKGGDLGEIQKGQTVKPFEDAAFSRKIKDIGPVVTTEYGHHIIEVLGRTKQKVTTLDEAKKQITQYLEQEKQRAAFETITARLRKNAEIIYYEN